MGASLLAVANFTNITIGEYSRRVNLRFCIDHRIAMAKKMACKGIRMNTRGRIQKDAMWFILFLVFFI